MRGFSSCSFAVCLLGTANSGEVSQVDYLAGFVRLYTEGFALLQKRRIFVGSMK